MIGGRHDPRDARHLPVALFAYAVALAAFLLIPPYLRASVGPVDGFTLQEAADLLTPVVVIPLAWLVIDLTGGLGRRATLLFLAIAAVWIEGQGIHLAANSVGDAADSSAAFYATSPRRAGPLARRGAEPLDVARRMGGPVPADPGRRYSSVGGRGRALVAGARGRPRSPG